MSTKEKESEVNNETTKEIKNDTPNLDNSPPKVIENYDELKKKNQELEKKLAELENSKNINVLALEQDLNNRDEFIEQLQKKIQLLEKEPSTSLLENESNGTADTSINYEGAFSELEKENQELMEDLKSCQEVIEALEERENWIPPEEFESKVLEEVLNRQASVSSSSSSSTLPPPQTKEDSNEDKDLMDTSTHTRDTVTTTSTTLESQPKATTSGLMVMPSSSSSTEAEVISQTADKEKDVLIDELKKKIEDLTLEMKDKSEKLEKVQEENKELYDEIKEYHEVIDMLDERENWTSPEEVEKIRLELYQMVVEKGFIETELEETKALVTELRSQWMKCKIENENLTNSYLR